MADIQPLDALKDSSLAILVDEAKVNELLKQKSGAKAFLRSACNVFVFICFLVLYTSLSLSEPFKKMRTYEGYIRRRFDEHAPMQLSQVDSVKTFWQYTNMSFLPALYGNDTARYLYPGFVPEKFLPLDPGNRIFGAGVRLRTVKIQPDKQCKVKKQYAAAFPTCYGPYNPSVLDTDDFGPITEDGTSLFRYFPGAPGDLSYDGKAADYQPGGFTELLTSDYNTSYTKLRLMEQHDWIAVSARGVFYDFTIYNFNLALYAVCSIAFEITPTGAWMKTFRVDIMRQRNLNPLGSKSDEDWALLAGEVMLLLFVIRYLLEEASEILSFKKNSPDSWLRIPTVQLDYFSDFWNILDWSNLIMMIVTAGYRVATWNIASDKVVYMGDPADINIFDFTDYSGVAANVRFIRGCMAFNCVLTWFKAVKYITVVPYITLFMNTVLVAQDNLLSFFVLFSTSTMGFVIAFSSAFGEQIADFRTPFQALCFLLRSYFGDADMNVPYEAAPTLGSMLIILYVIGIVFVMTNLFHSIIISGLSDAKMSLERKGNEEFERTKEKFSEFLRTIYVSFHVEERFRSAVPGLYKRMTSRKRDQAEIEAQRDEEERRKEAERRKAKDAIDPTGPDNPHMGRRAKRVIATLVEDDIAEEEHSGDESEPDLGPLRKQDQLTGSPQFDFDELDASGGHLPVADDNAVDEGDLDMELEPEAVQLVIGATRHVVESIMEHARGARQQLARDMLESKEVLTGIGNVLQVLNHRTGSLTSQQSELLRQHTM
eukprot:TRINITY_DN25631_c0_g1_i1.p1 TRINITY_DN25631_c0_g1~~TRINITY_DN25631_c0_g1_i1.p1  ORF type:complete len:768 (+),score=171.96 TRINITY_DN25631_c0_g1_i1:144-2447(+)